MKKIILLCVLLAMCVGNAVAQNDCQCDQCVKDVYYEMFVNNEAYRFDGKDAYTASRLQDASRTTYVLIIDKEPVHVYKLKGNEYAVIIGGSKYVCRNGGMMQTNDIPDIRGELDYGGTKEGFLLGYNEQKRLLAIYKK